MAHAVNQGEELAGRHSVACAHSSTSTGHGYVQNLLQLRHA